ncbi:MAG: hypothetical protein IJJ28_07750, partial [Lentisphaeria bacterium]|nr:hypothetical protein [Lentisphaeria bacterium]
MNLSFLLAAGTGSPGVYYAYQNSDSVGKGIVIFLIVGSVLTWTVMIDKVMALYRAKRLSARFLFLFEDNRRNVATPSLVREGENNPGPLAMVYNAGVEKLLEFYVAVTVQKAKINATDSYETCIQRLIRSETEKEDFYVKTLESVPA